MSTVETKTYTPDDLLRMPDSAGVELVHGNLVEKPMSSLSSFVSLKTGRYLDEYCDAHNLGVVLDSSNGIRCFRDDPGKVRKPDVSYFKRERFTAEHFEEGFVTIAPDVAVEVISTNDEATELNEKIEEYLAAGVSLVWVIDPLNEIIIIHRPDGSISKLHKADELSGEDVIPGFRCKVADLFPRK